MWGQSQMFELDLREFKPVENLVVSGCGHFSQRALGNLVVGGGV